MSQRMIKQFMEMVRIDSESGNEARFIDYLLKEFKKLGASAKKDAYGNLVAKLPALNSRSQEPILLSCHGDTVKPGHRHQAEAGQGRHPLRGRHHPGRRRQGRHRRDARGAAPRQGQAAGGGGHQPPGGSGAARASRTWTSACCSARRGFLLDNDTLDTIVIGGPSYFAIDVEIKGRSAHAGMEPEKGINAIVAAARAIAALQAGPPRPRDDGQRRRDQRRHHPQRRPRRGVLPGRVPQPAAQEGPGPGRRDGADHQARGEGGGGRAWSIKTDNLCRAVQIAPDAWTVVTAQKALRTVGIEAKTTFITGFTDASIYNNHGIEMAVVGIGARDEHSTSGAYPRRRHGKGPGHAGRDPAALGRLIQFISSTSNLEHRTSHLDSCLASQSA